MLTKGMHMHFPLFPEHFQQHPSFQTKSHEHVYVCSVLSFHQPSCGITIMLPAAQ